MNLNQRLRLYTCLGGKKASD